MRFRNAFLFMILPLFVFLFFSCCVFYIVDSQDIFTDQVENYLESSINVNAERIGDFIDEAEMDALFLGKCNKVIDVLGGDVGVSREAAVLDVGGKVNIISKEIENYLSVHSNMSLMDLQNSDEFRKIAVQRVGKRGYSLIMNSKNMETYFHPNQEIIGVNSSGIGNVSREIIDIFYNNSEKAFYKGFYHWKDADGNVRLKYMEASILDGGILNNVSLAVMVTTYVDDYFTLKNVSDEILDYFYGFSQVREYHNILFISNKKNVIYMTTPSFVYGSDFEKIAKKIIDSEFSFDDIERGKVSFYGPFKSGTKAFLKIMLVSSVYSDDEKIGFVVLIKDIDDVKKILMKSEGESYLVDKKGMLISSLKSRDVSLLTQEIESENVEDCLSDFRKAKGKNISAAEEEESEIRKRKGIPFLDFKGDLTLGYHYPIDRFEWCLISEINKDKILSVPMRRGVYKNVLFRGVIGLAIVLIIFILFYFIDEEYIIKRKPLKKGLCDCAADSIGKSFIGKLSLFYVFGISIILSIFYLFIVSGFFIEYPKFLLIVFPFFLVLIISIVILICSFSIKSYNRNKLLLGAMCLILSSSGEIILAPIWNISHFNPIYWLPFLLFGVLGFWFLLNFFGEKND